MRVTLTVAMMQYSLCRSDCRSRLEVTVMMVVMAKVGMVVPRGGGVGSGSSRGGSRDAP